MKRLLLALAALLFGCGFSCQQPPLPPALVIVTKSLPAADLGLAYFVQFAAAGGVPPYVWSVAAGALPPGLQLNAAGELAGVPLRSGHYAFAVRVADSATGHALLRVDFEAAAPDPLRFRPVLLRAGLQTSAPRQRPCGKYGPKTTDANGNPITGCGGGEIQGGLTVTIQGANPTVSGVSPNFGPAAGGTTITIAGTNFQAGATVSVGGGTCASVVVVSANEITCVTPAGSAGWADVVVTNPDQTAATIVNAFDYESGGNGPAPTVTGIAPTSGPAGGGTPVTITGTNFRTGATVTLGSAACTTPVVASSTTLNCTTPAGSGSVAVTVTNSDGTSGSLAGAFSYLAAPPAGLAASFFGFDLNKQSSPWPTVQSVPFGGYRSLGSAINWDQIATGTCTAPGPADPANACYNWTNFDAWLANAFSHGQDVLYTLYHTPGWANGNAGAAHPPSDLASDGTGSDQTWINWVTAVAAHVKAKGWHVKYWEIWNEPTIGSEWAGTTAQLVTMARDARSAILAADATAAITSPPPAGTATTESNWLSGFLSAGGGASVDAIGVHTYVMQGACPSTCPNPEDAIPIVTAVQAAMNSAGVSKPLLSTEGAWGTFSGAPTITDPDQQAAFLARYFLVLAGEGVSRAYWYGWDFQCGSGWLWNGNPPSGCSVQGGSALNPAGVAYQQVHSWLLGATGIGACSSVGTQWTCPLTLASGSAAEAIWDTSYTCSGGVCSTHLVTVPSQFSVYDDLAGVQHAISGHQAPVGLKPLLLFNNQGTLSVSVPTGGGSVASSPAGVQCPPTCSAGLPVGSSVQLTATASANWQFGSWSGLLSGSSNPSSLTMPASGSVAAYFNPLPGNGAYTILNQPPSPPYPSGFTTKQLPNAGAGGPTHLMPNSGAIVNEMMTKGFNNGNTTLSKVGGAGYYSTVGANDGNHSPIYYGQASDPVYKVSGCTGDGAFVNGMTFHAPSGAPLSQGQYDGGIVIWDQTTNKLFDFYSNPGTGRSLPACSGTAANPCSFTHYGNGYCSEQNAGSGSGYNAGNAASTAGLAPIHGEVRIHEIMPATGTGHIRHELRLLTLCTGDAGGSYQRSYGSAAVVFPATVGGYTANPCSAINGMSYSYRPPNGSLVFLDYQQSDLDCWNPDKASCGGIAKLPKWQYSIIEAMTLYGGTIEDTGNYGGLYAAQAWESEQAYEWYETHGYAGAKAVSDSFTSWLNGQCDGVACEKVSGTPPARSTWTWVLYPFYNLPVIRGGDVKAHMHIADPCVTKTLAGVAGGC